MPKVFKIFSTILGLIIISIAGSIFINAVIAAWTGPSQAPPDGNISNLVLTNSNASLGNLTLTGTNSYLNQTTNARFYLDSKKGVQIRLDSDANDSSTFAVNNGANQELFVIDESGIITLNNDHAADPYNANHLASKGYVQAAVVAAGGGDATSANQVEILSGLSTSTSYLNSIMGAGFDSNSSLKQIADATGDATEAKQDIILENLYNSTGWVAAGTYYSVGGNPTFCRQNVVSSSGTISVSNINNSNVCDTGKVCSSGACIVGSGALTWPGTSKTASDCNSAGGIVYDTGSGTICRFSGVGISCPSGWTQASLWQKYSSSPFGGDSLGNHTSTGPTTFSNEAASCTTQGSIYLVCMTTAPSEYWVTASSCGYNPYD